MKKNRLVTLLLVVNCFIMAFAISASAASVRKTGIPLNLLNTDKEWNFMGTSRDVFSDLKSTNPKVIKLFKEKDGDMVWVKGKIKKCGSATISYKSNGKTEKMKICVFKYSNPFKSFKIGKKDYSAFFKKASFYNNVAAKTSGKLSIKLKKGWKISRVYFSSDGANTFKQIKNGAKVTMPGGKGIIGVDLRNTKNDFIYGLFLTAHVW